MTSTMPAWPTNEQANGTTTAASSTRSGVFSAWPARSRPQTLRANSNRARWNPPQVPRNKMPDSRAERMAARMPDSLR